MLFIRIISFLLIGLSTNCSVIKPTEKMEAIDSLKSVKIPKEKGTSSKSDKNASSAIKIESIKNFHNISGDVYRSGQPSKNGFIDLEKYKFKSILSLRTGKYDKDLTDIRSYKFYSLPIDPEDVVYEEVLEIMKILHYAKKPLLIHGFNGAHRTGLISAMHRVVNQDWSKKKAINEMTSEKFHFHNYFQNIIEFINDVDITELKKEIEKDSSYVYSKKPLKIAPKPKRKELKYPLIELKSLNNWHWVADGVYRSEIPSNEAFVEMKEKGVKSVLNLMNSKSDDKRAEGVDLNLQWVKMEADKVNDKEIINALKTIKNAEKPILIHCFHGSDRTGALVASYRIIFENWSKKKALNEMINGGYGFHKGYENIPVFIKNIDIAKYKKKLELN